MKIAVCIKQVPEGTGVAIDPETHTLRRSSAGAVINPLDEFPLETALRFKDLNASEVWAFTMGPPRAVDVLARAVAMGADKAVLLSDPSFAGGDTWATSLVLAKALERFGPFDLILFGKQAIDGDTAQVGPETAAHLGLPQATYVSHVATTEEKNPATIRVRRLFEDFSDELEIKLPAVLTVLKEAAEPRFGTLEGRLAYFSKGVEKAGAESLNISEGTSGLKGSPTRVVKTQSPRVERKNMKIDGDVFEQAGRLAGLLKEKISRNRPSAGEDA